MCSIIHKIALVNKSKQILNYVRHFKTTYLNLISFYQTDRKQKGV